MIGHPNQNRIFGLDAMRTVAIMLVLIGHCVWIFPTGNVLIHQLLVLSGFFGVEIFFVLSGFLIGKIVYQLYVKEKFSLSSVFYFLKRRWFRTLPNYFLILLVDIGIAGIVGYQTVSLWKYFFFLQNFNTAMLPFFPESWSLSVEEFAYIVLPFFLLALSLLIKPKNKPLFFLWTLLLLIFVFIFNKVYYQNTTANTTLTQWNLSLKAVVIYRLDSIFIGVLCAWLYFNFTAFWQKWKVLFLVIGMQLFLFQFVGIGFFGLLIETHPVLWNVFYLPLISIAVACFLPTLSAWNTESSFLYKPVTFISLISYSMYLLHYSVVLQLMMHYFPMMHQAFGVKMAFTLCYFTITIVLSYFLHRFYEKPIMDLRNKNP